jgi:hypothetical protein
LQLLSQPLHQPKPVAVVTAATVHAAAHRHAHQAVQLHAVQLLVPHPAVQRQHHAAAAAASRMKFSERGSCEALYRNELRPCETRQRFLSCDVFYVNILRRESVGAFDLLKSPDILHCAELERSGDFR